MHNDAQIIQTDVGNKDGQNKCPKCGSTDISLHVKTGKLRCSYCRYEFDPIKVEGLQTDISQLKGQVLASGATDIIADANNIMTFKCSSCGAEVVIDTSSSTQARCHWCRNTLSVNNQIPNGAIPDIVLPFGISKDEAKNEIAKFVHQRRFFANPKFKQEFTTDNIMGVYFPYMLIDLNAHANLKGYGEKLVSVHHNNNETTYDADLYSVNRDFDLTIEGLTIESSSDKLNKTSSDKTNNVINAIMPFDIESGVKFDSNYLKGYTSEKRDTNIDTLKPIVETQAKDITRYKTNETIKDYDRGVCWESEQLNIKGEQWKSAYLPVWLYSYQEVKKEKKTLHYVAVNARTREIMGSIPIHYPKLILMSFIAEIIGIIAMLLIDFDYNFLFLLTGIIYFIAMIIRYRNSNARHEYEKDTKSQISNLQKVDQFIKTRKNLKNSQISGINNNRINGKSTEFVESLIENNEVAEFLKNNLPK